MRPAQYPCKNPQQDLRNILASRTVTKNDNVRSWMKVKLWLTAFDNTPATVFQVRSSWIQGLQWLTVKYNPKTVHQLRAWMSARRAHLVDMSEPSRLCRFHIVASRVEQVKVFLLRLE